MPTAPSYEVRASAGDRLRVLLVLGRVSNLPTVWSNCLAAWIIAGGAEWNQFTVSCVAATFLYLGGMFLNDAFDVAFDSQYRPERPIPSGQIHAQSVWMLGIGSLGLGWLAALSLGMLSCLVASVLLLTIVIYDWCHKRFTGAPWIMAGCRLLVYLLIASGPGIASLKACVIPGLEVFAYILGLSFLARVESRAGEVRAALKLLRLAQNWPVWLLFLPVSTSLAIRGSAGRMIWLAAAIQAGWLVWCITRRLSSPAFFRTVVAGLLAGIPLIDWLNASPASGPVGGVFFALFLFALALQRWAPAT